MSLPTRGNDPPQAVPVYTVYSEGYQGNVNQGFQHGHFQTPPPKYEDVINGRPTSQHPGAYEGAEQAGVIFVAPVYKYSRAQRTLGSLFAVLFLLVFVSVLIKILSFP